MRASVLFLTIFLFGCAAIEKQTRSAISSGEKLYRSNCSLCHRLYAPDLYNYQELGEYIKRFSRGLSAEELRELSEYLNAASKK